MSKPIKVDRLCTVGVQVGVNENCVTQFIVVIIGNILRHVAIEILEGKFVGRISNVEWAIVGFGGSAQLVVLSPKIALYDLSPCREPEKIRITFGKSAESWLSPAFCLSSSKTRSPEATLRRQFLGP
jgi:hypothetical protein